MRFSLLVIVMAASIPAAAQEPERGTWSIISENDSYLFDLTDKHYSSGIRFSYVSAAEPAPWRQDLARAVMLPGQEGDPHYGLSLAHVFFTPKNLTLANPDSSDRPYGAWLHGSASMTRDSGRVFDRAELTLGWVGPAAGGEFLLNTWHDVFQDIVGVAKSLGWSHQIKDEPGIVIAGERKWRLALASDFELVPEISAALGNIYTYAGIGGALRFGNGVRADWGPPRIGPGLSGSDPVRWDALGANSFGWYVFVGGAARAVARNIFLDGNSFVDSAHVTREAVVGDITAGVTALIPGWRLALVYTARSKEFTTQVGIDRFVGASLSAQF